MLQNYHIVNDTTLLWHSKCWLCSWRPLSSIKYRWGMNRPWKKHQGKILYCKLFPTNKGGKEEGAGMRSVSALVYFFVQPVKDQDLVNQTWFYSAKWGISPRTTSKVGQDKVTAVCSGRQHKPWLPNTPHTHTHTPSLTGSWLWNRAQGASGHHCRECTPGHALVAAGQTALQGSAAVLSQGALGELPVTEENIEENDETQASCSVLPLQAVASTSIENRKKS